ncbi:MAG: hypothetical protein ACRD3N_04560 [Terracidiphilus sp.]
MKPSRRSLRLPTSIKRAAQRLAKEDGVSLNQRIAVAVAQRVGTVETAAEFFRKSAAGRDGSGLAEFLRNALAVDPEPADRAE